MKDLDPRLERTLAGVVVSTGSLEPDWRDVITRAKRARRRSVALAALAAGCLIAGVSTALAFVPRLLGPGPLAFMRTVKLPETGAPAQVRGAFAAHRFAGEPRRAARLETPQGPLVLWVSPHRGGGWCQGLQRPRERFDRGSVTCAWWKARSGAFGLGMVGPQLFWGRAAAQPDRTFELALSDGRTHRIRTNDGFYLFRVPDEVLIRTAPRALVLYDHDGDEVARQEFPRELFPGSDSFGGLTRRPGGADVAPARRVLERQTSIGPAAIWTAPSKFVPARCWWLQIRRGVYGGGCVRYGRTPRSLWEVVPLRLRVQGHRLQLLWGQAGRDVAALELHFQDGKNRRLEVVHGFFLYVVPRADYRAGHRPAFLVARRADGKILGKRLLLEFTLAE